MDNTFNIDSIKGLFSYDVGDSNLYLRDVKLTASFFKELEKDHFVVLSGNSGIGKTSFLNCIFDDRYADISNISEQSLVIYFRPGLNPFISFAQALSTSNFSTVKFSNTFASDTAQLLLSNVNGLYELFKKYPIKEGFKIYIVVDPFDDIFLYKNVLQLLPGYTYDEHVDAFINMLCYFEKQCRHLPVYIVLSYSNTFPENINRYPKFIDLFEKNKFVFNGYTIDQLDYILGLISPEIITKISDYDQFVLLLKNDLQVHFSNRIEWLYFFQHAYKQTIIDLYTRIDLELKIERAQKNEDLKEKEKCIKQLEILVTSQSLCKSYAAIGCLDHAFNQHANSIFENSINGLPDKYKRIYEVFLRRMMDTKGRFIPNTFKYILQLFSIYDTDDFPIIRNNYLCAFIQKLADTDFGFIEIIRSTNETDRTRLLIDKNYISDNDVITVRNPCMVSMWSLLENFHKSKIKLINDFEWLSRMAFEKKKSNLIEYPFILKSPELSQADRDKKLDSDSIKSIDEISYLNEEWVELTFKGNREGCASVRETQLFIKDGIQYWKDKEDNEIAIRNRKEKIKSRSFLVILICILFVLLCYRFFISKRDDLEAQFDCFVSENIRISSYIDQLEISKLREHALRNQVPVGVLDTLAYFVNQNKKMLSDEHDILLAKSYELYGLNDIILAFNYFEWTHLQDSFVKRESDKYDSIFKALSNTKLLLVDTVNTDPITRSNYISNPNFKDDRLLFYILPAPPIIFPYTSLSDSVLKNRPISYYLTCKKCNEDHKNTFVIK